MPKTPQDFLEEARRDVLEVSVEEVATRRTRGDEVVLLDVREKDEVRAGYIEGAVTIPRGFLEFQVAGQLPQTDQNIVVYCAGGVRSLLAAKVLRAMGYTHVTSMAGGITRWREAGYPVVRDRQLSAEQLERYSRHFLLSQIGEKGQGKLLDAKVLLVGAGGLGSPAALYLAAAGIGTLGIVDADVVDLSNLQWQVLRQAHDQQSQSRCPGTGAYRASYSGQRHESLSGLRHHRRWLRQFPDALPLPLSHPAAARHSAVMQ
jgi:sulfur-carrier protein adenylyltransferase/sulfurtransferase